MKLTRLQYKALKVYERTHVEGYTIGQVLRICWRSWLLLAAGGVFGLLVVGAVSPPGGWLLLGLCIGAFARDIGRFQVAIRIWPVTQQILDWKRISELIEAHEKDTA